MERFKLLIAIPSNTGRSTYPVPFTHSLVAMCQNVPEEVDFEIKYFGGLRIDQVRLNMVYYAKEHNFDIILFLDDDMIFPADTIQKLFTHIKSGKRVISGIYMTKKYPFSFMLSPEYPDRPGYAQWLTVYEEKLYRVNNFATGCLMVDMSVFEEIQEPYFLLQIDKKGVLVRTEDVYFSQNCYGHQIPAYLDATILCEHIETVSFPGFFTDPYIRYRGKILKGSIEDKPTFGNITNRVRIEEKNISAEFVQVPMEGTLWHDGIVDCAHSVMTRLPINEGETQLFKCESCGLISSGFNKENYIEMIGVDEKIKTLSDINSPDKYAKKVADYMRNKIL